MLSQTLPESETYTYRVTPLKWLEDELIGYSCRTVLVADLAGPYLRAASPRNDVLVRLDRDDGERCYTWGTPPTTHPLFDPAGAARRIATMLARHR